MLPSCKQMGPIIFLLMLVSFQYNSCASDDDFQTTVDRFMDAFDDAYSTEINAAATEEVLGSGNEIPVEVPTVAEEPVKEKEQEEEEAVDEELVVTERFYQPGEDVRHELNAEVRALAERAIAAISPTLRLLNVSAAVSSVTDKIQRSLTLEVARNECEGELCSLSCRVELISLDNVDQVTWHNCLDFPGINEVTRDKRGAIGGFKQVDEDEAKELAEIAVQTLDSIDADDNKRVVIQVLKAQKQLVNGIMYHMTLEVALTDCKETDEKCDGKYLDQNICKILMQRLFSGDAPRNAQVIKSECTPISQIKDMKYSKRGKRFVTEDGSDNNILSDEVIPTKKSYLRSKNIGGKVVQDPNSDKIKEISEFVLATIDKSSNSINKQKIVRVVEARSQVVAGVKYFLKLELMETNCRKGTTEEECESKDGEPSQSCEVVVWEKAWEKFKKITKVNCTPLQKRKKRGLLGGKEDTDPNSDDVQEVAKFAVSQLDTRSNSLNSQKLLTVKEAQTQVVAGTNYYLKLQMVETNCRKGSEVGDHCVAATENVIQECDVVIYDRPWDKHREMTSANCTSAKKVTKRSIPGGLSDEDPKDAKVQEMATFAISQLDAGSNSMNSHKLVTVIKAQTQTVAGTNYYLKLQMVETNCKKGSEVGDHCVAGAENVIQECDVVIYDRPWDKHREMLSANCTTAKKVTKRGLFGGNTDADPNGDKVQEMAKFAVSQLDTRSNSLNSQKLVVVKEAQTQVVAGTNYYLKLQMVETNCKKGSEVGDHCVAGAENVIQECDVVIYDRPWDKHREMLSANCTTAKKVTKRGLVGGKKDADPNSDKVQEMAKFAVSQLNTRSNSLNSQKLLIVKEAKTQTVAGTNYYLKLQMVETNCRKGSEVGDHCVAATENVIQECDVVIYDRPWDKHREMTSANCTSAKKVTKRSTPGGLSDEVPKDSNVQEMAQTQSIPGGLSDEDPEDAKVKEMATFAISQLEAGSNSMSSYKMVKVIKAQTQVVAGKNYYLKLQLIRTNWKTGSEEEKQSDTSKDMVVQECDVVVYDRPWDNHREMSSANCATRILKRAQLVGGSTPQDKNCESIKKISHFAVEDISKTSNALYKHTLVEVISAYTQVVSGLKYILKLRVAESDCLKSSSADLTTKCAPKADSNHQECDVEIWSQPWLNKQEVTKKECKPVQVSGDATTDKKTARKREVQLGAHSLQDKDSDEIKEVAQFAVGDLNKKTNSMYKNSLLEVISAKKQVAAGINYHLKLRVAESNCKKIDLKKSQNCSPRESGSTQECDITVWSRPWLNTREVTSSICKKPQNKQVIQARGGPKSIDVTDSEVKEAAKYVLKAIDSGSNSYFKHALLRVVEAKVQTVSGKKYFLTLEVGESECPKSHVQENCAVRAGNALNNRCNAVVWNQPWLDKMEVLDFNCGIRSKRSVASSLQEKGIHFNMFEEFKRKYNKVYTSDDEHKKRFRIFRANLKKIKAFQDNEQGTAVYGANMFADLTEKEFKRQYLGLKHGSAPKPSKHHMVPASIPDVDLPTDFDWRDRNVVTPVKNQGQCGSCWAFSVTGNIEGQWALKHGQLLSFSEQELVDCDKTDSGCNGGYMTAAYEAIEQIGGLELEDEYPYDAQDETCKFNSSEVKATVVSSVNITTNETQIAQWLFANGPISIGLNANAMQFYMGGVSHPLKFLCSKVQLDHGVLLVGFGVHKTSIRHRLLPYWLIKNSWGPRWGEKGYYRLYRGDGTCGVNQMCSSAVVG